MNISSSNIETHLPLLAWENKCLISKFSDVSVLYELSLPEVYTLGEQDFDHFHQTWLRAIKSLPDFCIVHKQDFFLPRRCHFEEVADGFLSKSSDRYFEGRAHLQHRCFVYLTLTTKKSMSSTSLQSILCKNRVVPAEMLNDNRTRSFLDKVEQFEHLLSQSGIPLKRLNVDEVAGNRAEFGIIEQYLNLDFSKKSHLSDLHVQDKDFMVGDKYLSLFSIAALDDLPPEVSTYTRHDKYSTDHSYFPVAYPSTVCMDLPFEHVYNQYFFLDDHKETLSKIEKRGREQASLSGISRENSINKEFNDEYLNEAVVHSRRSVRAAFNVLCWDENYLKLLTKNSQIGARLSAMDCTANKTEGIIPQVFWGGIPGAASQYPSEMSFLTFLEQACCFINHESNLVAEEEGFGIRLCDRIYGTPLKIDISDAPRERGWIDNRNKFVLGPSGSGKSFFTNHMLRQYYEQGSHVVVVDVGDSYQGLCHLIQEETGGKDGIYFTYTEDNPISFNPFYEKSFNYTVEKKEQLVSLIFCLWKNENELITKAEETHVATAINDYLNTVKSGKVTPSFNTFYAYLKADFNLQMQERSIRRDNFDLDNLLQVLRPYAKGGMYDYLLNAKENLDLLSKRFIVFEIDAIKDHKTLFPVVTLILMDTFISKMRHASLAKERKVILIEEAWKAISKSGTAEFIQYLYKTVRKHFGEAIVVTQEVEDIIGNEIVKNTIISNADCKILLDQRKYANKFDEIQQILAFSDKEKAIALSVNRNNTIKGRAPYKEVFITLNGNHSAVYALEVSPEEYLTYTTEKKEKVRLMELEIQEGSIIKAIKAYLLEK